MDISKKTLAISLSKLKPFNKPNARLEQYSTDSEVASDILWHAAMAGHINGKAIADLGAGTGILGIGCLMLGAGKVHFVEVDPSAVDLLRQNLEGFENFEIHEADASEFSSKADTVIMNPPFGTRHKGADIIFLERAASIANTIYSLHKTSTLEYVRKKAQALGLHTVEQLDFSYPLKMTMEQHRKKVQRIEVSCLVLQKNI